METIKPKSLEVRVASALAGNSGVLQIGSKELSFGSKTNTKNFIDESAKAEDLTWKIENKTGKDVFICIGGITPSINTTIFESVTEVLAATSADALFQNGVALTTDAGALTISSMDSKRKISQFMRYAAKSPLRFTKWSMKSAKISTGDRDSTNYDNMIKAYWFTPFDVPVEDELNIRPLQVGGNNFNPDMLDIDFLRDAGNFKAIVSNENFLVIQVNKDTVLTLTAFIGAQLSQPQKFYRLVKDADEALRPVLAAI